MPFIGSSGAGFGFCDCWAKATKLNIPNKMAVHTCESFMKFSLPPSYTEPMSIVRNIAAIAKGMSITGREAFAPTEVENYPDGPGPLRGAVLESRFRGAHVLQRDEDGLEKCVACLQHRLQPLHLLRLLRRSLPHGRDHARPRI